ncbi:excisionase family DNA-binding protein [Brevibacillus sp. SYP-B805]|uniref:excisionase family DNA-binding protein n=1 Tax=Brevibacillus sp. SYP-B805 TaxID=1578199 RepID=UPI0013EE1DB5|nr:excisionase family DNA-binding protein [Brevibacillus sp. SYP-B805]NGQ96646.1 excisionase family DNA-binding protein [Brevibacillus sp. SYP-B805]
MDEGKTYLTLQETAEYLELPASFILEKIREGRIRAVHNGEEYLINKDQFAHHLEQMRKLKEFLEEWRNEPIPESYDVKDED